MLELLMLVFMARQECGDSRNAQNISIAEASPANGRFLTVEHGGRNFMGLVASLPHG